MKNSTTKNADMTSFEAQACVHVKVCICASVWVCTLYIETVIEAAIYQQLHFPQRPQCSCTYKLFKMHEKMK